jgi:hypothetical protein
LRSLAEEQKLINHMKHVKNIFSFILKNLQLKAGNSTLLVFIQLVTFLDYMSLHTQNFLKHFRYLDLTKFESSVLQELKKYGIVILPDFFNKNDCLTLINEIEKSLKNYPQFINHGHKADQRIYGCENLSKLIKDKFTDIALFKKIGTHFNQSLSRTAFTLAAKMEYKGENLGSGEGWHRDAFFKQFKTIVYLTDTGNDNGPFQYIKKSQKLFSILKDIRTAKLKYMQYRFSQEQIDKILKISPERLATVTGRAGTLLIIDTSIIHRGKPIENGSRYALTNYFYPENEINQNLFDHFSPGAFNIE